MNYLSVSVICWLVFLVYGKEVLSYSRKNSIYNSAVIFLKSVLMVSPLIMVSGLRDSAIGIDTLRYSYEFEKASTVSPVFRSTEPLFSFLLIWLNKLYVDFQGFLFLQSFLYYLSIASCLVLIPKRNYFSYFLVVMCLGLFSFGLSGIRQSLAISIFLLAVIFLLQNRVWMYVILGVVSFFVHNSSIVAFCLALIAMRFPINAKSFFILVFFSPLFVFLNDSFLYAFSSFGVKQLIAYSNDGSELLNFKVPLAIWVFTLAIGFTFLYSRRFSFIDFRNFDRSYSDVKSLLMWGAFFVCCFFWMATSVRLVDRLGYYFIPFVALLASWILGSIRNTMLGWIIILSVSSMLLVSFFILNRNLIALVF